MDSSFLNEHVLWYLTFEYVSKQHFKWQGQKFYFVHKKFLIHLLINLVALLIA